jgi:hypothetical protein
MGYFFMEGLGGNQENKNWGLLLGLFIFLANDV